MNREATTVDDWAKKYARIAGALLVIGFFTPIMSRGRAIWNWDLFEAGGEIVAMALMPLLLGILALVFAANSRGRSLAGVMVWAPLVYIILLLALVGFGRQFGLRSRENVGFLLAIPILLGPPLIAAGNHLRKRYPDQGGPRALMGVGGLLTAIIYILLFAVMADQRGTPWVAFLFCGAVAIYGIVALFGIPSGPRPGLCAFLTGWARGLIYGIPVLFLLFALSQRADFGDVLVGIFKQIVAGGYAPLLLFAAGIVAWYKPAYAATNVDVEKVFE